MVDGPVDPASSNASASLPKVDVKQDSVVITIDKQQIRRMVRLFMVQLSQHGGLAGWLTWHHVGHAHAYVVWGLSVASLLAGIFIPKAPEVKPS